MKKLFFRFSTCSRYSESIFCFVYVICALYEFNRFFLAFLFRFLMRSLGGENCYSLKIDCVYFAILFYLTCCKTEGLQKFVKSNIWSVF